jgi:hypothetical protein
LLPAALYSRLVEGHRRAREFASEAVSAEAEVVHKRRPNDGRVRLTYRYTAGGEQYTSEASVRQRDARRIDVGSRAPIRYLASEPGRSWFGRGGPRRPPPVWLVLIIPPVFAPTAGLLIALIRRQSRLLSEGRATVATVTRVEKRRWQEAATWRVHYEWTLLSGARRGGRHDLQQKTPPAPGTTIPIVYHRDNPRRHARYPFSLVRIPGAPGRGKARAGRRRRYTA